MRLKELNINVSPEKAMAILESFIRRNNCSMTTDSEDVLDGGQTKGYKTIEVPFLRMIKHNPEVFSNKL